VLECLKQLQALLITGSIGSVLIGLQWRRHAAASHPGHMHQ
jgi:hypothetical protein